jgi:hypothetical protein
MGRSGGNAQTETLLTILNKRGYDLGIDVRKVMNLSENLIKPLIHERGVSAIDVTAGYALFHSKFLKNIYKAAEKYSLDPRELIVKASEKSVLRVPEELAMTVAEELSAERRRVRTLEVPEKERKIYFKPEDYSRKSIGRAAKKIATELLSLSKKTGKESIFTISVSVKPEGSVVFPFIRENYTNVIGNAEIFDEKQAIEIAKAADGIVDYILVDAESKLKEVNLIKLIEKNAKRSKVLSYKDSDAWVGAAAAFLSQSKKIKDQNVLICGCNNLGYKLALDLAERGARVALWNHDLGKLKKAVESLNLIKSTMVPQITAASKKLKEASNVDVLVGFTPRQPIITKEMVEKLRFQALILDAGIVSIERNAILRAQELGMSIYRLDMRAGLSGEIINILETRDLIKNIAGKSRFAGVPVVAGGFIGERGDIVIDSISNPTKIIGVANGTGRLLKKIDVIQRKKMEKVKSEILKRKLITREVRSKYGGLK